MALSVSIVNMVLGVDFIPLRRGALPGTVSLIRGLGTATFFAVFVFLEVCPRQLTIFGIRP